MVDLVPIYLRTDAEMVPVRRVDHILILQHRIAPGELCDRVVRSNRAQRIVNVKLRPHPERHRMKIRAHRFFLLGLIIESRRAEQLLRSLVRDPSLHRHARHVLSRPH